MPNIFLFKIIFAIGNSLYFKEVQTATIEIKKTQATGPTNMEFIFKTYKQVLKIQKSE